MHIHSIQSEMPQFDPELYIKILITIAKADRFNGTPEFNYVRSQADRLGVDYFHLYNKVDKTFSFQSGKVPRRTALLILKDCIVLASMDGNFSLAEKEKIYGYAEQLDIPRRDVDQLEKWLEQVRHLEHAWLLLTQKQ
jgi:hypothetical protein